jgi:hypothetical protein
MATITSTIGTASRNYSTLQAWEDALPASAVAAGNDYVGEVYKDSEFVVALPLIIAGIVTDATHGITLRAAAGQSFRNNANVRTNALRYNAANGVAIRGTSGYNSAIEIQGVHYVTFDGLQIAHQNNGRAIFSSGATPGSNTTVQNCLCEAPGSFASGLRIDGANAVVRNTLVVNTGSGLAMQMTGANGKLHGNTVVKTGTAAVTGIQGNSSTEIRNTVSANFATCFTGMTAANCSNNASTDATAPGANSKTALTLASLFEAPGTDYRTKSGSALIDAGTVVGLAVDISNTARPQGSAYDIGAWEVTAPATSGFTFVRSSSARIDSDTGALSSPATALTAGNHVFVHIRWESGDADPVISDTAGNTYTILPSNMSQRGACGRWFYCLNAKGNAANSVSVTLTPARFYRSIRVLEFSAASAAFDKQVVGDNGVGATTVATPAFSTTGAGLVLVGESSYDGDAGSNFGAAYTSLPVSVPFSNEAYWITTGPLTNEVITFTDTQYTQRNIEAVSFVAAAPGTSLTPVTAALAVTGYSPSVAQARNLALASSTVATTGYAPNVAQATRLNIDTGVVGVMGYAPSIAQASNLNPLTGVVVATGFAPSIAQATNLFVDAGSSPVQGYVPAIAQAVNLFPDTAASEVTGFAPSVAQASNLVLPATTQNVTGYAPTVQQASAPLVLAPATVSTLGYAPGVRHKPVLVIRLASNGKPLLRNNKPALLYSK